MVRRACRRRAIGGEGNNGTAIALAALAGAVPGLDHRADLGSVRAQHVLTLGLRPGGLRQRCGQLRVLSAGATDLKRHGELQCHHVGVAAAPLAVHELHRPVGVTIGARNLSLGARQFFAPLEREHLGMLGQLRVERVFVEGDGVDRRLTRKRPTRGIANPPNERDLGAADPA